MTTFMSRELREGLDAALREQSLRKSRLRVGAGTERHAVIRCWSDGFAVPPGTPRLRGFVDLYDGEIHLAHCLIVASEEEAGEMRYDYKQVTIPADRPAADFIRDEAAPVALIEARRDA